MTDSSETTRFSRLNDTNYAQWAIRMEAVLVRRGLWSLVDISVDETGKDAATIAAEVGVLKQKRIAEKMNEARAEMILRVDDGQLSHMGSRDPMEIWQTLRRVHRAAGFATSLALRRRFLTAKKDTTQSMQAWIGDIQSLGIRMVEAGIEVTDQDKILALTMGLSTAYDAVIINFDSTPPELLTLDHVITRLLNEETRQTSGGSQASHDHHEIDEAMIATPAGRRPTRPTADVTCYFCDEKGHYKSECPEKRTWEKMKKSKAGVAAMAMGLDSDDEYEDGSAF